MSFILDALKKSERDRQHQAGPSLFEVKVAPPRRSLPIWAMILGALLIINAAVLSWVLLHHPAPPAAHSPAMSSTLPLSTAGETAHTPTAPAPIPPSQTANDTSMPPAAAASAALPSQAPVSTSSPDSQTVPQSDTSAADLAPAIQPESAGGAGAQSSGDLPRYQDLVATPGTSLPALHLDLHVYDADPRKRYVMINMQTLREGESLANGVSVVAIRPDGAVLSYQGRQFLLAR